MASYLDLLRSQNVSKQLELIDRDLPKMKVRTSFWGCIIVEIQDGISCSLGDLVKRVARISRGHLLAKDRVTGLEIVKKLRIVFPQHSNNPAVRLFKWFFSRDISRMEHDFRGPEKLSDMQLAVKSTEERYNDPNWLRNKALAMPEYDFIAIVCYILHSECKKNKDWDLKHYFPLRTQTSSDVAQMTVDELFHLDADKLLEIMDLITAEQVLGLLKNHFMNSHLIIALFYFNEKVPEVFANVERSLFDAMVDEEAMLKEVSRLNHLPLFIPDDFTCFMLSSAYAKLDEERLYLSGTSRGSDSVKKCWKSVNAHFMPLGLTGPISLEFLEQLNADLRFVDEGGKKLGYRGCREEISISRSNIFGENIIKTYILPGAAVLGMMQEFIIWFNAHLQACDEGRENPVIFAAQALLRFLTIHPFHDGNGRTGRLLMDMILRRFNFLPSVLKQSVMMFPFGYDYESCTPLEAVKRLVDGIENAYSIVVN